MCEYPGRRLRVPFRNAAMKEIRWLEKIVVRGDKRMEDLRALGLGQQGDLAAGLQFREPG